MVANIGTYLRINLLEKEVTTRKTFKDKDSKYSIPFNE